MFKSSKCNNAKLKSNLSICIERLKLLQKKKTEMALKSRREIADYLQANKIDRARIRVEFIIREDYLVEAMEIVEMYCDLFRSRFGLFESMQVPDEGLKEGIATLIWVAPRLNSEVPELSIISKQLALKYGEEFVRKCRANEENWVNVKVMRNLNMHAPPCNLCEKYCVEIARSYDVDFAPDEYLLNGGASGSSNIHRCGPSMPLVDLDAPGKLPFDAFEGKEFSESNLPYPLEPTKSVHRPSMPPLPGQSDNDYPDIVEPSPPPYSTDFNLDNGDSDEKSGITPSLPKPKDDATEDADLDDLSARFNRLKGNK